LHNSGSGCPVLLISGAPLGPELQDIGREFLLKPFTRQALLASVKRLLETETVPNRTAHA
jgi:hypothetical protein